MTACLVAVLFLIPMQVPQPATSSEPVLGEVLYDGNYGFSLRPPADWAVSRRRETDGGITVLLRMSNPGNVDAGEIAVEHTSFARDRSVLDCRKFSISLLKLERDDCKMESQREYKIGGREVASFAMSYKTAGQERYHCETIVAIAPRNFLMLKLDGSAAGRIKTEPAYAAVLKSLKLLASPLSNDSVRRALSDGADWLEKVNGGVIRDALVPEQFLVCEQDGRPVGATEIYQRPSTLKMHGRARDGFEVVEQSWTFGDDGTARRAQSVMFLGADCDFEKWQTSVTTYARAAGDKPERFENAYLEGLRDNDILLSSQAGSISAALEQNQPLKVPRTYISNVIIRMLPALIGKLDKPRTIAFVTYDAERVGLVTRVVELKGPESPPDHKSGGTLYRIDIREGVAAEPSQIYADATGRVDSIRTRQLVMRRTTLAELKKLFEARTNEAEAAIARMSQLYQQNQSRFLSQRRQ